MPLLETKRAQIGVMGLGYVGLPLSIEFARHGFDTVGFDLDPSKVAIVNDGRSYIPDIKDAEILEQREAHRLVATVDFGRLRDCDAIVICVPTPLNNTNEPDVSHILSAARTITDHLRRGQLIVLESTTYPGSTDELLLPVFRKAGFELDTDFLLAFSPERIDPGNATYMTNNIPKIVGGCSEDSTDATAAMYGQIVTSVHAVSSSRAAEATKLLENTFRSVNIGLINEMSVLCRELKIDVWEIIEAAATKPFGFMPFYPGPGLGGHCIPLDPQYLAWKARQHGLESRFINVAHEVNAGMPRHVVSLIMEGLNETGVALNGSRILVLGAAYKKDIDDARESPAADVIRLLRERKAIVSYHDPHVPIVTFNPHHIKQSRATVFDGHDRRRPDPASAGRNGLRLLDPLYSVDLTPGTLRDTDAVVIVTDHSGVDYKTVVEHSPLIIDTRNVLSPELRSAAEGRIIRL